MPAIKAKSDSSKTHKGDKCTGAQRDGIVAIPVDDLQDDSFFCTPQDHVIYAHSWHALAGAVEYPLDGPARAAFRTRDGKAC